MHKKLILLSILFSFSAALSSWEHPEEVSESCLQVINKGRDAVEALCGRTPMPENLEQKIYSNAELVLDNQYLSYIIQQYLSSKLPSEIELKRYDELLNSSIRKPLTSKGKIELNELIACNHEVHQVHNHCIGAIEGYDYITYKKSIEMLKLLAARFSYHTEKPNYIRSYRYTASRRHFLLGYNSSFNLLHYACNQNILNSVDKNLYEKNQRLIIQELYDNKVDINAQNNYGETPIYYAAKNNSCNAIQLLHTLGAEINAQDNYGNTPMHNAAKNNSCNAINLLYTLGAETNIRNENGNTSLHIAVLWYNLAAVKTLLNLNADTTIVNNDGNTAEQMPSLPEIKLLFAADRADRQRIQENRANLIKQLKVKLKCCLGKRKRNSLE